MSIPSNVAQRIVDDLNAEIAKLTTLRDGFVGYCIPDIKRPAKTQKKKSTMSAEGRKRIAAAQRKRWAAQKAAKK